MKLNTTVLNLLLTSKLSLFCLLYSSISFAYQFTLNDFSNILPHPYKSHTQAQHEIANSYLFAKDILPQNILQQIQPLNLDLEHTKLIAYRFTCKETKTSPNCMQPELRLILQAFSEDLRSKSFKSEDQAIHLFYSLSPKIFKQLLLDHAQLRTTKHDKPTTIVADQNLAQMNNFNTVPFNLDYLMRLNTLLKHTLDEHGNLYKLTFLRTDETEYKEGYQMTTHLKWFLGAFAVESNVITRKLPFVVDHGQEFETLDAKNNIFFDPIGIEQIFNGLGDSEQLLPMFYKTDWDNDELVKKIKTLNHELTMLEDAAHASAERFSCLSCHAGAPLNLGLRHVLSAQQNPAESYLQDYVPYLKSYEASNLPEKELSSLHLFSYVAMQPVISQVLINQTVYTRNVIEELYF
ncbi:MAG TPA: hypothetical protein PKC21_08605 [Oligoflexia bacterium]|nr:hypothetical protein [Oligoflexia bacterium]HMR25400.1 hypothetical protein [Oligoflexia bacterium]